MVHIEQIEHNHIDDHIDDEIIKCLDLENPQSFFLFAGAGSGKTRSLVTALEKIRETSYQQLRLKGQRVAIITYTNAACEEIGRRLDYDPLFSVSTIHTFVWELIKGFNKDISEWLYANLTHQITDLEEKQRNGRPTSRAFVVRQKNIEAKQKRINNLKKIKQFTYNPNGINQGKESLNHSEVISIGAYFLSKPLMQKILIKKFPILLVDESQDTNKELLNALFEVERKNNGTFSLGLFGDTMQRIYSDGKEDLGINLPENWKRPVKKMNHRCPKRIVKLINRIRSAVDDQEQRPRTDKEEGHVHFFILPSTADRIKTEELVAQRMAQITEDEKWIDVDYMTLILEHHMAATRLGFSELFQPLHKIDKLKTGLLEGSLPELNFFTEIILPIFNAHKVGNKFAIASIARKYSRLLRIQRNERDQLLQIKNVQDAINQLLSLWNEDNDPLCIDVLQCVARLNLFEIPDSLYSFVKEEKREQNVTEDGDNDRGNELINAWDECLKAPFSQINEYASYITGTSNFMTHQGVKGLEFPRVMVIIDDHSAGGFLFSYEKLFGAKDKTKADAENENVNKDTTIDRTRRLFYVTCSRAEKSLAIVAYSEKPEEVKKHVLKEGWFEESEVEIIS
ncbi:DNA helicase-2 / ATP-dependent DNA helicase PcrA [Paenibacillus tianmuensis]|uniref:DNA helicase-2 / ATP-dependent DNA helicase PcrA n=1 Tax=Paenibacillus tianmuensis TaxID=624147 RepID=A0A1G4SQB3_9BACL|nr:UvrD-helicase domain-containing protein [Paenibacillus tianmuensis]SCW71370.1 DNA helicase-2 / ATP-dependent DNA helicase PcrA [Paenibacillus tianmuensis]